MEWTTRGGSLTQALLNIQKTQEIDLVIMGTFGTNTESDTEHTNTSKLVLKADCPVLVVPRGHKDFQMKRIALVLGKEEIDDTKALGT
ncbi:Universal stress protein family protein [Pricia antarctica]|uniref:Universal stress protein family protein n=1 Tax=Pricia antarctica TaxID=641691 RepID=A0A1G7D0I3_9FLAO|nr:Universal stress protein family protein [Pricia antarctica]